MPGTLELASPETDALRQQLSALFEPMMQSLHSKAGAQFSVDILREKPVQDFIDTHAQVLDAAFSQTAMSDRMRQRLQQSDYIFSGIKTFHELNEAFPSLVDESGNRKPFEQFLNDVRKIDETYNKNYLRAEYNFVQSSAEMAGKWEQIEQDGDRYNLQYRTAGDSKVRPEHAALNGVTLPPSDPFWQTYYPPNGWNCRCTVVQVRKTKYPTTPRDEAMQRGAQATGKDTKGIFQFNAGMEQKTFPDYNPYTIKRCRDCDIAKGKLNLARPLDNELCDACKLLRVCQQARKKEVAEDIARSKFEAYPSNQWKHSYFSAEGNGFVVTEKERLLEATASPNEREKFRKEYRMCRVAADNGYEVQFLKGNNREPGQTYDILLDSLPTDLKSTGSMGNLVKHIRKAYKEQGSKAVLLELESHNPLLYEKLNEAKRKYDVTIYFYFKDDTVIRKI